MDYSSGSLINIPRYQFSEQLEQKKKVAFNAKMVISTTPAVMMICSFVGRIKSHRGPDLTRGP
jgi:hypothetical protein